MKKDTVLIRTVESEGQPLEQEMWYLFNKKDTVTVKTKSRTFPGRFPKRGFPLAARRWLPV